jgi:branched-chain amino acid transport system substrate-binding protein
MKSRPFQPAVLLLPLLVAGGFFLSCAKERPAGDPHVIKMVSSLPRTGSANAQSTSIVNGIRIAIEEVGAKVAGYTILYEDWDDASPQRGSWDPALEAANADRAIKDPDVMVYIGTFNSGAAKISIPKLNQANLVMVSPANTYPGLTKPGKGEPNEPEIYRPSGRPNFFRVVPADDIQGARGAEWAKKMGCKSVFVVHDRELYGKGITDVFRARAEEIGLKIAGVEGIDVRAPNYKALATKIKAANVDLVYFGGVTQSNAGQFTKDLRASGFKGKLMVPDGCVELAFIQSAGPENVFETYATFGGLPADQLKGRGAEFVRRYREKYQIEPEAYAAYGYEAGRVSLDAIARAGKKDRLAILEAVAATRDFDGVLGRWSFDPNGDTSFTTMSGLVIKDGRFQFVETLGGDVQTP